MPEIPLLGQGTTTNDDEEFANLTDGEREQLAALAEEREDPDGLTGATSVATAFFVVVAQDGQVTVTGDVTTKVVPDRVATLDDILSACSVALSDIQANKTAQITAFQMAQLGRVMQDQQQQQQIAAQLAQKGGYKQR